MSNSAHCSWLGSGNLLFPEHTINGRCDMIKWIEKNKCWWNDTKEEWGWSFNHLSPLLHLISLFIKSISHRFIDSLTHLSIDWIVDYTWITYERIHSYASFNSSLPSAAYMRRCTGSALVQLMACRLFGAKPSPAPVLTYYKLAP